MSPARHAHAVVFWLMVSTSLATLAPCLLLPAGLEYRQSLRMRAAKRTLVARLEAEVTAQERQVRHLHEDVAYNERILREELGIQVPGVRAIYVEEPHVDIGPRPAAAGGESSLQRIAAGDELFPAVGQSAELAVTRYPDLVRVFLDSRSRRWIMVMSGLLLLAALVLIGGPRGRNRAVDTRSSAA
jgi:hypothetical protein